MPSSIRNNDGCPIQYLDETYTIPRGPTFAGHGIVVLDTNCFNERLYDMVACYNREMIWKKKS